MPTNANALLADALAIGVDQLSEHDCWVCIAYLYASGNNALTQIGLAMANGYDGLSNTDVLRGIGEVLNP